MIRSAWRQGATSSCFPVALSKVSNYHFRWQSTVCDDETRRLRRRRNVGVFAHVDAGKTTVTERMLALAGVTSRVGTVDEGDTVTDYLPAERERGITIQSAACSFPWQWPNGADEDDGVEVSLIDTPGHVDFTIEVNRTVAVLDGGVLVIDSVAGVQAQTETVWKAMSKGSASTSNASTLHEPLPCLSIINKMDKDGSNFGLAMESLRKKLPGANPVAIQQPVYRTEGGETGGMFPFPVTVHSIDSLSDSDGSFVGSIDLINMRAVLWPDASSVAVADVDQCTPTVVQLLKPDGSALVDPTCKLSQEAMNARDTMIESLADVDEQIAEAFLEDEQPTHLELIKALRRATLKRDIVPVLAGAALRGKGIEPLLDAIADLLPSPLDRRPPELLNSSGDETKDTEHPFGHPLCPSLLALAFKVVHMKGRGGSGDGRVVFARVYSGSVKDRAKVSIVSPVPGEPANQHRTERVGGMLELAGGTFDTMSDGICRSGDVCAIVGMKSVVTGDTILDVPTKNKKKSTNIPPYLAGVGAPKPVLKVRLEVETSDQQRKLEHALNLLVVEDPSLVVEETEACTMLSGLGELHIEVVLDRLRREFGVVVYPGTPLVAFKEMATESLSTNGLVEYDKTIGDSRLQAAVQLVCRPFPEYTSQPSHVVEPRVIVGESVFKYLGLDSSRSHDDLMVRSATYKALVEGCSGALRRGPVGSYRMVNTECEVQLLEADEGAASLESFPGALRASAAHAVMSLLNDFVDKCVVLEPSMKLEITAPEAVVGGLLSDLTGRGGHVDEVLMGDEKMPGAKALIHASVPLREILGYANILRSLSSGEATFSAEYHGHVPTGSTSLR